MLKNYLKIALRNLSRRKGYAFINIAGLAIGMACSTLIFLSVRHDLSYDRFHEKADRIFRVLSIDRALGVSSNNVGVTIPALGPAMAEQMPEVERQVRLIGGGRSLLSYENEDLYADNVFSAESTFFDIFDFELVSGSAKTALSEPLSIVLTETLARRIFGDERHALGKTIRLDNDTDMRVTGVMEDVPSNSHLQFDAVTALLPTEDQEGFRQYLASWGNIGMMTYVVLKDPASAPTVDAKIETLLRSHDDTPDVWSARLQPLKEIHLQSSGILFDNNDGKSDAGYVYGLSVVALFVLVIAIFNFMNLATARSADRAREVGLRKVVGANRKQLIAQHLGESFVLCAVAFVIAMAVVMASLGFLNAALGKELTLDVLADPTLILYLVGMAAVVALLSGSYPAFVLSKFQPVEVLKGTFKTGTHGRALRRVLVVTQFTAAVVMIIGSLVVSRQLGYVMNKNMGYDREQVLVLDLNDPQLQQQAETLEDELARHPAIRSVARSSSVPGRTLGRTGVQPEGASDDDNWIMSIMAVDDRFFETLGIEMAAGRDYSTPFTTDTTQAILINEAAARSLGWQDPIGKRLTLGPNEREVVGVVKDFHFASVRHQIEPVVFILGNFVPTVTVKIDGQDLRSAMAHVESTWKRLYPDYPFEYTFLDEEFAEQYQEEANFAILARGFTILSILIACLGLFGLASFTAEQRTKEIGVRKVLGASVSSIVLLLSKEFARLVLIAFVLAAPVAYLLMNDWLTDFAYRIDLGPGLFVLTGLLALTIALLTVSYQALKAALADPVKSLRYE